MKQIVIYGENRHAKATRTRVACRGVILSEGKLLLVHEEAVDQWLIPGGGLEEGETLEECCIREMAEETGSLVQPEQCYLTIHEYYQPLFPVQKAGRYAAASDRLWSPGRSGSQVETAGGCGEGLLGIPQV